MVVDKPQHKQILLELINNMTFKGEFAEVIVELKKSISDAKISES